MTRPFFIGHFGRNLAQEAWRRKHSPRLDKEIKEKEGQDFPRKLVGYR